MNPSVIPASILTRLFHHNDMTGMDPNWKGWGASDSRYAQARYLGFLWLDTNPKTHRPRGAEPEKDAEWEWRCDRCDRNDKFIDDPYVKPVNIRDRWNAAIEAHAKGEPIQHLGYNNYGGHHYWNSGWVDMWRPVDWEKEIEEAENTCAYLGHDFRPKPKGLPDYLTYNNYRVT